MGSGDGQDLRAFVHDSAERRGVEPEAMRYALLTMHYRAPFNLEWKNDAAGELTGFPQFEEAERRLEYVYSTRLRLDQIPEARIVDGDDADEAAANGEELHGAPPLDETPHALRGDDGHHRAQRHQRPEQPESPLRVDEHGRVAVGEARSVRQQKRLAPGGLALPAAGPIDGHIIGKAILAGRFLR